MPVLSQTIFIRDTTYTTANQLCTSIVPTRANTVANEYILSVTQEIVSGYKWIRYECDNEQTYIWSEIWFVYIKIWSIRSTGNFRTIWGITYNTYNIIAGIVALYAALFYTVQTNLTHPITDCLILIWQWRPPSLSNIKPNKLFSPDKYVYLGDYLFGGTCHEGLGNIDRSLPTIPEAFPIQTIKEWMFHEVLDAILAKAPLGRGDQPTYQILGLLRHVIYIIWKSQIVLK